MSWWGLPSIRKRSLKVPGSISSALAITYLGLRSIRAHRSEAPLDAGREAGAAPAAQAGILDFLLDLLRRHVAKGLTKRLIPARPFITREVESLAISRNVFGQRLLDRHVYLHSSKRLSIFGRIEIPMKIVVQDHGRRLFARSQTNDGQQSEPVVGRGFPEPDPQMPGQVLAHRGRNP